MPYGLAGVLTNSLLVRPSLGQIKWAWDPLQIKDTPTLTGTQHDILAPRKKLIT